VNTAVRQSNPVLVEERKALQVYFEALLRDIPDEPVEVAPVETPVAVPAAVVEVAPAPAPAPTELPAWGESRFQAMLFKVAGLTLAVPLIELSGVQEWGAHKVTPLPGHVLWFLGLTLYRDHNVPVIDTAQLVLPEERRQRLTGSPEERLTRIVFIGEGRWGLACDEVAQVISLEPGQVRWRTQRTSRAWLAGTVIEHMCALIDPSAFAQMLATGVEEAGLELPADES
jgi:purine-binding chemotaxis protein CheW